MLTHLSVKQFAIVRHLDIEFDYHTTAITGETGAGKSIAIDALSLCLGSRAEASMVRKGAEKAEVTATFALQQDSQASVWLHHQDLEDSEPSCIVRRVISKEGRSRAWINGNQVTLQQMKELGRHLLNIHGQHAHQAVLKPEVQRHLLDHCVYSSASHSTLLTNVEDKSRQVRALQADISSLEAAQQQRDDRKNLLQYQLQELDEFALAEDEFNQLEAEFKRLSHSQTLLEESQQCLYKLYQAETNSALAVIDQAVDKLSQLVEHDAALAAVAQLLGEAQIQVHEACSELRQYVEGFQLDPATMQHIEERYTTAVDLARKHNVLPELLYPHHQNLRAEWQTLTQQDGDLQQLTQALHDMQGQYAEAANALSKSRRKAARALAPEVTAKLRKMNMPEAAFEIAITASANAKPSPNGIDDVQFLLKSNKGLEADVIDKVASGGELSRISLALQVLANSGRTTMIFDEVDTGISGATAAVVGQLLRELGENNQVICVTHLPQVAAKAHQQMLVAKSHAGDITETQMHPLSHSERITELARLLAGDRITDSALENAKGLLAVAP